MSFHSIENSQIIAEEMVIFNFPNGGSRKGRIFITAPVYDIGDKETEPCWWCLRGIDGLVDVVPLGGNSSLYVLTAAIASVKITLDEFRKAGGQIQFTDGSSFFLSQTLQI
ncbi:MAG: hypothetical protein KIT34_07945 [Cyanobacteria bacterium TGS_CYA1]|nr:hypothetical protein [Cyanobacteria bacterium TGS_CYA1]